MQHSYNVPLENLLTQNNIFSRQAFLAQQREILLARTRTSSGGSPPAMAHAPHLKHLMRAQSSPAVTVPLSPPQPALVEEPTKHNFTTGL